MKLSLLHQDRRSRSEAESREGWWRNILDILICAKNTLKNMDKNGCHGDKKRFQTMNLFFGASFHHQCAHLFFPPQLWLQSWKDMGLTFSTIANWAAVACMEFNPYGHASVVIGFEKNTKNKNGMTLGSPKVNFQTLKQHSVKRNCGWGIQLVFMRLRPLWLSGSSVVPKNKGPHWWLRRFLVPKSVPWPVKYFSNRDFVASIFVVGSFLN